jgi:beta-glucanase (GH16 family)
MKMKRFFDRLHHPKAGLLHALLVLALLIGLLPSLSVGAQTTNLALNKPVTCSPTPQFPCAEAVDGNTGTRWASAQGVDPQFIQVDLGATFNISRVVLIWEAAYATGYQVQISSSASGPWTNLFSTTTGNGATDDLTGLSGSGRYVRMNGTARATQFGYSLWEFQVYGTSGTSPTATRTNTPPVAGCGTTNAALNKPATSSSNENAGTTPNLAVDGNTGTRWSSAASDPQWIQIDLGSTQSICRVVLTWETAYGTGYQIQVSGSATGPWTNIFSTTTGNGATDDLTGLSGSGRYIRMNGTARATQFGYSLWEFAVYTGSSGPTNTPTRTNTPGTGPTLTPTRTATRTNTPIPGGSVMLSYHAPAVASTIQNDANCANCTADKVVDQDMSTRWATAWADPQWIYLDLGATANITRVVLKWEAAFASAYQIQVSGSATGPWTNIFSTTTGNGATDDLTLNGSGRFVRLNATTRGTGFGYSLFEFEVYGTGGAPQATPTPRPTSTPHGAWILSWSDEFNGPAIDTTNWNYETGCTGFGNGEWENYTNGANSAIQFDAQANSNVMIVETRQTGTGMCGYTSSRMTTQGKREFTYGRIEARLKLPQTQGIWPAFWMMGNNIGSVGWPTNGEIDIMEHVGSLPTTSSGALHGPGYSGGGNIGGAFTHSEPVNLNYHIYAIEWAPEQIKWFVDNNNFLTVTREQVQTRGAWVYDHPFFILLNVAVGGAFPGYPDGSSTFPQRLYVDYIRVYR